MVPRDASWLLVLRAARDRRGRCWLRVWLPARPNHAAAWVNANRVVPEPTRRRLVISRAARTISVYRGGDRVGRFRVVIGAPPTPTPHGLFSIVDIWPWNPRDFLGSYILPITAHSNVLQEFGGGDGDELFNDEFDPEALLAERPRALVISPGREVAAVEATSPDNPTPDRESIAYSVSDGQVRFELWNAAELRNGGRD